MELDPTILTALLVLVALALGIGVGVGLRARRPQVPEVDQPALPDQGDAGPAQPVVRRPSAAGRFFAGLARSREALSRGLASAFGGGGGADTWAQPVEDALIAADVGVHTAAAIVGATRTAVGKEATSDKVRAALRKEIRARLGEAGRIAEVAQAPLVILVVGVNGSGKTTTIGKLAARYTAEGRKVMLAAGDTFRAGAIEQLKVWGERAKATVIAHQEGADPAAVIFDALQAALARGYDVVICDTAGRLQAQKTLMDELSKVRRVMSRARADAPHEVLLVLDATIGQNALSQARIFKDVAGVTGVALTKLDGTARGGVVVAVGAELGLPVKLVGLGEKTEDLRDFDPDAFVDALLGVEA